MEGRIGCGDAAGSATARDAVGATRQPVYRADRSDHPGDARVRHVAASADRGAVGSDSASRRQSAHGRRTDRMAGQSVRQRTRPAVAARGVSAVGGAGSGTGTGRRHRRGTAADRHPKARYRIEGLPATAGCAPRPRQSGSAVAHARRHRPGRARRAGTSGCRRVAVVAAGVVDRRTVVAVARGIRCRSGRSGGERGRHERDRVVRMAVGRG